MSASRTFGKKKFKIYDAFPTKAMANKYAKDIRQRDRCGVRIVKDPGGGRLKYLIYVDAKCRQLVR